MSNAGYHFGGVAAEEHFAYEFSVCEGGLFGVGEVPGGIEGFC